MMGPRTPESCARTVISCQSVIKRMAAHEVLNQSNDSNQEVSNEAEDVAKVTVDLSIDRRKNVSDDGLR